MLSADCPYSVYSVPDEVADNLKDYCNQFSDWLYNTPAGNVYRDKDSGMCFDESAFIDYLNTVVFPNQKSFFVEFLFGLEKIPEKYKNCPSFNF